MKKGLMAAACISILLFGGCDASISAEDIMSAPKLSITAENIQGVIKENLGEDIKLIKPKNLKGAIKFIDIDNDNQDEIFVFYALKDEISKPNRLRTAMFDYEGNELEVYNSISGNGYDFDKVYFSDLDGDKRLEIVMGYAVRFAPKALSIYKYSGESLDEVSSGTYDEIATGDIDNDGKEEILLTKINGRDESTVSLYQYKDEKLIKIDEQDIGVVDFRAISLKVGLASKDTTGVFIDGVIGANTNITNMFIFKEGKLINPFKTNDNKEGAIIEYWETTESKDIDGDGIIEMGIFQPLKGYENVGSKAFAEVKINWYRWDEKHSIKYVMSSIVNRYENYEILFPEGLDDNITFTREVRENKHFDVFEYINGDERKKIFEMLTIKGKENTEGLDSEYKYLNSYKNKIYFVRILNEKLYQKLNFDAILKNNFMTGWGDY